MTRPGSPTRPGSSVINPAWEQHHRPTAESVMTADGILTRPDPDADPVFDPATGSTTRPVITVYTGACRLQALDVGDNATLTGEQQVTGHTYRVSLPYPVDAQVDDTLTVTTASDPTLTGRKLRITDVARGSLVWQRDLIAVDDLG